MTTTQIILLLWVQDFIDNGKKPTYGEVIEMHGLEDSNKLLRNGFLLRIEDDVVPTFMGTQLTKVIKNVAGTFKTWKPM